jgi:hypothetical protein
MVLIVLMKRKKITKMVLIMYGVLLLIFLAEVLLVNCSFVSIL